MSKNLGKLIRGDWFYTYFILIACTIAYLANGNRDMFVLGFLYIAIYNIDNLFNYLDDDERERIAILIVIVFLTIAFAIFVGMNTIK